MKKLSLTLILIVLAVPAVAAQEAEVKITLDEPFFDALLEAVFTNLEAPSVELSSRRADSLSDRGPSRPEDDLISSAPCDEAVVLKKQIDGVRTAVRFRQGKIYAPIAFLGNYNPPLIGCIEFQGWAETNIDLRFDRAKNALVGKVSVLSVNLSGTGGIGSSVVARLVQASIDRKINPIEIISLDKLSFNFPVRDSGSLKMTARGIRHTINERSLDVFINYGFSKGR